MVVSLRLGTGVLVVCGGRLREGYDDVLLFQPPFGPCPSVLSASYPIGQSEIPDWDDAMVRQGCKGMQALIASHPESRIAVAGLQRWRKILQEECGETLEVID